MMRAFFRKLWRYTGQFFTNWREYDAPIPTKLWLGVRNRGKAIVLLRGCCGHDGEPGC